MQTLSDYKTMGALLLAVSTHLVYPMEEARRIHLGTPAYFRERARAVHEAFCRFLNIHGISDQGQAQEIRSVIAEHVKRYRAPNPTVLIVLCEELPDIFNVRGVWTPPDDFRNGGKDRNLVQSQHNPLPPRYIGGGFKNAGKGADDVH